MNIPSPDLFLQSIQPSPGTLSRLRTKLEAQSPNETTEAYICETPIRDTSKVLGALKNLPHHSSAQDLPHLRRVVRRGFLPRWLKPSNDDQRQGHETSFILICPTSTASQEDIKELLETHVPSYKSLFVHAVPRHAPTSAAHALVQTQLLWPTVYNPNSAYGPNPAEVAAAEKRIIGNAGSYISLARHVGRNAREENRGEHIGVVVVERADDDRTERIVCVAGDARWVTQHKSSSLCRRGNPANHAVLRAIAFIAQRRRELKSSEPRDEEEEEEEEEEESSFPSSSFVPSLNSERVPSTPLESSFLSAPGNLNPAGYLALNLDFYVTHEPCLMCSMALVHSRVGKVVFARRMYKTGGLCAETEEEINEESGVRGENDAKQGLGYGIFWRPELNWRFLCWQWQDSGARAANELAEDVHA